MDAGDNWDMDEPIVPPKTKPVIRPTPIVRQTPIVRPTPIVRAPVSPVIHTPTPLASPTIPRPSPPPSNLSHSAEPEEDEGWGKFEEDKAALPVGVVAASKEDKAAKMLAAREERRARMAKLKEGKK
jgi:hypothetical protein